MAEMDKAEKVAQQAAQSDRNPDTKRDFCQIRNGIDTTMNLTKFVFGSLTFLINLYADFYQQQDLKLTLLQLQNEASLPRIRTYDFIIVGGGAAGCVLSARLSTTYYVLLLEAGGNPVPATQAAVNWNGVISSPRINYIFQTIPQTQIKLINGGLIKEPTGKMLGGSTSHNALSVNRGHPLDFEEWARLTNDTSWRYQNVLKYFRKIETFIGLRNSDSPPGQHGENGPILVNASINPLVSPWLRAGSELGYKTQVDSNGPQIEGFSPLSVSIRYGRRVSAYTAYLKPAEQANPETLRIERYSVVEKILMKNGRAYGVLYHRHGIPQIAHARKEVIVSCGAMGSPILLMRSGIGPAQQLKEAGIKPILDLPVGVGLRESPILGLDFTVDVTGNPELAAFGGYLTQEMLQQYFQRGQGPITLQFTEIVQAMIVSSRAKQLGRSEWPDIRIVVLGFKPNSANTTVKFGIYAAVARSTSLGSVKLNTKAYRAGKRDDESLAVLDLNMLTDPGDMEVLLEGTKLMVKVLEETLPFQELKAKIIEPKVKACANLTLRSDEYWICVIRQVGTQYYHILSSCRIGFGADDKGAVLDSKFNVLGVQGLKVVDASAMPASGVNANPTMPIYMMAEKAAEQIKAHWNSMATP